MSNQQHSKNTYKCGKQSHSDPLSFTRRNFLATSMILTASKASLVQAKTQPNKKLGIALLGLGSYSEHQLAPALQLTEHCELRGLISGTPHKIKTWKKKYNIADKNIYSYDTLSKIADNPDIDVIYVVTPTGTHLKFAQQSANAGKHVWCEKPMAMTVKECQNMIDVCKKNNVRLAIGYRMQHEPNTQTVIEYAKSKPYGKINKIVTKAGYAGGSPSADNWRLSKAMGGGALYDMGVYPINGARYASGLNPISVSAKHENTRPKVFTEVDETTNLILQFENGLIAECETSVGKNFNILRVNCEKGWYELSPMQSYSGVEGYTSDNKKLNKSVVNQQAKQMDDDALAIIQNTKHLAPGEDGLEDIRIVEAALQSAKTGKEVILR